MSKKKKKVSPTSKYSTISFKVEETVQAGPSKSVPVNLAEEKARFIRTGLTPRFEVIDQEKLAELASKTKNQIRFDLQGEAEYILEYVRDRYGDGEFFLEHAFGTRITKEQATPIVLEYINENSLSESLKIHWCDSLACSAKMVWKGPVLNANRPELRKYSLWINWSDENNYMRESGIKCLMDHEIGTHFFRLINDGFQPWFSDRTRFDLRSMGSFEGQCTEEGLASIHTALRGRIRLLWSPAMAYYTACKAAEMSFKQLFDHLGRYTSNIDFRWKQVMRVKRGLADARDLGGFGNDQCYFEGAVKILRNMDNIDFHLLMSGKICMDEVDRIKRVVRRDVLRFPTFMKNMVAYRKTLKKMLVLNGLDREHVPRAPPSAFTRRLQERNHAAGDSSPPKAGSKKVRSKLSKTSLSCKLKGGTAASSKKKIGSAGTSGSKKKLKNEPSPEVESFKVSNRFINQQQWRKAAEVQKETETRTDELEKNVRASIATLDCDLGRHIEHLQSIISEHTWSSCDSGYKESLISEVSNRGLSSIEIEEKSEESSCNGDHNQCYDNEGLSFSIDMSSEINSVRNSTSFEPNSESFEYCGKRKKENESDQLNQNDSHALEGLNCVTEICNSPEVMQKMKEEPFKHHEHKASESTSGSPVITSKPNPGSGFNALATLGRAKSARHKLARKKMPTHCLSARGVTAMHENCLDSFHQLTNVFDRSICCRENEEAEGQQIQTGKRENMNRRSSLLANTDEKQTTENAALKPHLTPLAQVSPLLNNVFPPSATNRNNPTKMLNRVECVSAINFRPHLSNKDKCVSGTLTKVNMSPTALHNTQPFDAPVKFRMPTIKGSSPSMKSFPQEDRKILLTDKALVTQTQVGVRQMAGVRLGSLASVGGDSCMQ